MSKFKGQSAAEVARGFERRNRTFKATGISMSQTLTLADFLLARIAEDEVNIDGAWAEGYSLHILSNAMDRRMRIRCEADRRIVEDFTSADEAVRAGDDDYWPRRNVLYDVLRLLAAVYADHPDYRDEWTP